MRGKLIQEQEEKHFLSIVVTIVGASVEFAVDVR